ncbi:hypothetical protein ATCC90586_007102 [Pythium insidiosum]|nr:hypothetical protein ATCC90586_007102 [Pythium insidiosum]
MADGDLWRDRNKVFVAGIPSHVDDDALYAHFRPIGEMFQAKVVYDSRTGRSKGFGFLTFCEYVHALDAVSQMNQTKWENRVLNVRFLQPKAGEGAGAAAGAGAGNGAGNAAGAAVARRPAKVFGPCPVGCTTVYVGNLAYDITEEVLRKVFLSCGDIKAVRFAEHIETKEFRGFGYVQFYDSEACEKAVRLDGMIVMGRPMNIDYGMRDEVTEKAREVLQQKLKKGVCHKFQSGECTRGDECKFAHVLKDQDPEELLSASASASASAPAPVGAPQPAEATQAPSDAPICINFQKGKCKRGAACRFQHLGASEDHEPTDDGILGEQDEQPEQEEAGDEEDDSPVCLNFQKGKCKRGDKCRFRHAPVTAPRPSVRAVATPVMTSVPVPVPVPAHAPRAPVVEAVDDTPICQSYQQGKCKRGVKCRFRHVDADEAPARAASHVSEPVASDETPICQSYQQGKCKRGAKCRFRHVDADESIAETAPSATNESAVSSTSPQEETPICQSYVQGKCKRGLKCRFRHVDSDDIPAPSVAVPASSAEDESMETEETPICQSYVQGKCKRGVKCRFRHVDGHPAAMAAKPASSSLPAAAALPEISICKNFTMGRCTRGASCRFAHTGDAQVAQVAPSTAHSEYQKRFQSVCYNWQRSQSCARGDACPFDHSGGGGGAQSKRSREERADDDEDDDVEDRKRAKKQKKAKKERRSSESDA